MFTKIQTLTFPLLIAFGLLSQQGLAQSSYLKQYEDKDVIVRDASSRSSQKMILRSVTSRKIAYSPVNDPYGILEMPLEGVNVQFVYEFPSTKWNAALSAMRSGGYEQAVFQLRSIAYPVVKFLRIPEENFSGHQVVEKLYEALIMSGMQDEALELAKELPLNQLNQNFKKLTFSLADTLVKSGDTQKALEIMKRIPMKGADESFLTMVIQFAHYLKNNGNIKEAIWLYERLKDAEGSPQQTQALLWVAYLYLQSGKTQKASLYLDTIVGIDSSVPEYPLYKLGKGLSALQQESYHEALKHLTEGIVVADISEVWMPELMYATAQAYEKADHLPGVDDATGVAISIYKQLIMFYPNLALSQKAKDRLAQLPSANG